MTTFRFACANCGEDTEMSRPHARYCSKSCRNAASAKRGRAQARLWREMHGAA